jgi:hypothetical protein
VTRTEAEYAAVLADLLIEARGDGVDVAMIMATAIGDGPTAIAEIEALRDRCSQRLWPASQWTIGVDWAAGEGSPPPSIMSKVRARSAVLRHAPDHKASKQDRPCYADHRCQAWVDDNGSSGIFHHPDCQR